MQAYKRMLKYISIATPSDASSKNCPSTEAQFDLARLLMEEMHNMGITNTKLTEHCFLYASLPATSGYESKPKIGFIAHLDTVSDYCDKAIQPLFHYNYTGEDLPLGDSGRILKASEFPHLTNCMGQTIITSDGTTILGADDKAGIAEILSMAEYIIQNEIPHGTICIAFTPDEEMYNEVHFFDIQEFGADYAFTLDGNDIGEIQYENFYASDAHFMIQGVPAHPENAKNTMINASLIALEINSMLPDHETPRDTEGYEGYFHLSKITGDVKNAELHYSIRDHDKSQFEKRKQLLHHIEQRINQKWGENTVSLIITDLFRNMAEVIGHHPHLIENAVIACRHSNIPSKVIPARGITDGCRLSFQGLPCPNLGTGGHGYHTPYEHITVEKMDQAVLMLVELVKQYSM